MWKHAPGRMRVNKAGKRFSAPVTLSDEYIEWLDRAGWHVNRQMAQRAIGGQVELITGQFKARIEFPAASRRDEDNWVKPIFDLLQRISVVRNDSGLRGHEVAPADRNDCMVALWDLGGVPLAVPKIRRSFAKPRARRATVADVARWRRAGVLV